ncbi:esterase/lipase family protein [Roseateles violae]|uniref:Alpha/beta fold hydrolase n=1 Tax=Roseateles violae TaxID=3058042 RepID=A0ABT8DYM9_9BURK|nr:alpha/beta fold hydrolase [Pelomonas sp. PFR6]MDN3922695.1 alpha/beta fold hydrolase [Pelomonas sp. PFR6]
MNGRLQRWQLLLRLLLALAIAVAGWRAGSPGLGLLLAALLFWFHGLVMLGMFLSLLRINRGANGIVSLLRAWARELWVCERVFGWQQPFAEHREPDFVPAHGERRGVLLLHGYTCNRGLWNGWMRRLRQRGHPFIALSLEPAFGSIDAYVEAIEAAVQRLTASSGRPPLIVAHSMGGLAARAWWRRHGAPGRVQRVLTLGSPHGGTLTARFSPALNARQMRPGSAWLAELAGSEARAPGAGFDCYYSAADQIVCPAPTAVLDGSRAVALAGVGHLALVFERRVFEDVLRLLD